MSGPTCLACRWASVERISGGGDQELFCRRWPPTISGAQRGLWPCVYPADWCGEFVLISASTAKHRARQLELTDDPL